VSADRELPDCRGRAGATASLMTAVLLIAVGVGPAAGVMAGVMVGLGACASTQPTVSYEQLDQRKQEIAMLWSQIRGWRQDAGLRGVEPPPRAILEMRGKTTAQAARVCPQRVQPQTQRCGDVCSLADAICENADRICRIADEIEGDAWASGKCSSAKASCKEARQACCRCWSEETPAEGAAPPADGPRGGDAGDSPGAAGDSSAAENGSFFWTEGP
jgi:hypothetical protein